MREERRNLRDTDPFTIIEYIKSSIEILLSLKLEEKETELRTQFEKTINKKKRRVDTEHFMDEQPSTASVVSNLTISSMPEPPKDYETVIQKLEGDVRTHIRIGQ